VSSDSRHFPRPVLAIAAIYCAAHLLLLAPSLEDIDSTNFALGLREFDVAKHQPHPPGYPVYIALGRTASALLAVLPLSLDFMRLETLALSIWSPLAGAFALLAAFSIFRFFARELPISRASFAPVWATALLAASPLFWITGSRPMSDMPGLALALVAQALFLKGRTDTRALLIGAMVAGLAVGVRVQTACLTVPLFVLAIYHQRHQGLGWIASRPVAALAFSGLLWAIPLIVFSGGLDGYLRALGTQAGEDFAWTGMLWTTPAPRRLLFALWQTFVLPWDSIPLGTLVSLLGLAGVIVSVVHYRAALTLAVIAFMPYALFHLLFQETIHVRYAMPILPAIVWLVACGATVLGRVAPVLTGLVTGGALWFSVTVSIDYARERHPAYRAIADLEHARKAAPHTPTFAHFSMVRLIEASSEDGKSLLRTRPQRGREWLDLVNTWRDGWRMPVWFLADPKRTDLGLIDPQSRKDVSQFRWSVADRPVLSGTRPLAADWYRINPPGWFVAEGWALTPETGGIAQSTGTGVDKRPIEGYVRRRPGPMHLLIGGHHFSAAGDPPVVFTMSIDGTAIETWNVEPGPGGVSFLRFVDLPNGLPRGTGDYAHLVVAARAEPASRPTPQVAIRQFDIQSRDTLISGFGEGWHEAEYDNASGVSWRWTSGRSVLRISPPQTVRVHIRGESPLKYFDEVPTVKMRAGDQIVGELRPETDFEWAVTVLADAIRSGDGSIVIETDRIYLPGQVERTSDSRRLGLRLFEIAVNPVTR
jgi:hypothetical protein